MSTLVIWCVCVHVWKVLGESALPWYQWLLQDSGVGEETSIFTLHIFIMLEYFTSYNALVNENMHDVPRKILSTVILTARLFAKTLIPNAVNN